MNDFFRTSDGQEIGNEKEYDKSGGFGDPLPDNTDVLASVDTIQWDEYQGEWSIKIQWQVVAPEQYKGRKIFHNLKVEDNDLKKADKNLKMLRAIDAMHGEKLFKLNRKPKDEDLAAALVSKLVVLKLGLWEIEDEKTGNVRNGNWVKAVSERKGALPAPSATPAAAPKVTTKNKPPVKSNVPQAFQQDSFDDDIPF